MKKSFSWLAWWLTIIPLFSFHLRKGVRSLLDARIIAASGLFDSGWYLAQNPDVAAACVNPLAHYIRRGAAEGRDPGPLFDGGRYLAQNPDVAAACLNPLAHYIRRGAAEGRDPGKASVAILGAEAVAERSPSKLFAEPGHFYSPIVDPSTLPKGHFTKSPEKFMGIDLNIEGMDELWDEICDDIKTCPFPENATPEFRYYLSNDLYGSGDAAVYYALIRKLRPARVYEIGSGFSSAVLLDTIDRESGYDPEVIFIEPYPDRLMNLLRESDHGRIRIISQPLQTVNVELFDALQAGDILFIDSTHVVKTGSDVCYELFEILPRLKPGVWIHFHDIFYPFEYPEAWVCGENRSWNEMYALRALLMFNNRFKVEYFCHFFASTRAEKILSSHAPRIAANSGCSIWLKVMS